MLFRSQALAQDYKLVDYEDLDCLGEKWEEAEQEVVVLAPEIPNVRKYITALYLKNPFSSEERIRDYAQLVEGEQRMPAKDWMEGYAQLLKDPLVKRPPLSSTAVSPGT